MVDDLLLGEGVDIRIVGICLTVALVTIEIELPARASCCPACGGVSSRQHGFYWRTLGDLSVHGHPVCLRAKVRRFFCDNPGCPRRTFAEPLVGIASHHARKTDRLLDALRAIGLELGGEAGARLSSALAIPCSADRLLAYVKALPLPGLEHREVIGVDDFAFRKRERYGTIICDQLTHEPVDLLPDRASEPWADWLRRNPGVTLITRDRGGNYALGAENGAPGAVQVADRFHLLMNLRTVLERLLLRFGGGIEAAWKVVRAQPSSKSTARQATAEPPSPNPPEKPVSPPPEAEDPKRARRWANYQQVMALHGEHLGYRTIAARLGLGRNTVRKFLRAGAFPERAPRRYHHNVARFAPEIQRRWEAGCHNAVEIFHELQGQGFDGSYQMVRRWVSPWRTPDVPVTGPKPTKHLEHPCQRRPSPQQVSWLLVQKTAERDETDQRFLDALLQKSPVIAHGARLAKRFAAVIRERKAEQLDDWLVDASADGAPGAFVAMARSLRQDYAAVRAAIALPWSQGLLEGHVNRLKMIKRQMYGRAGFELLRHRVLCRSA